MLYYVMAVSEEEYALASKDCNYIPQEHKVGEFFASSEHTANLIIKQGIKRGSYPKGSIAKEAPAQPARLDTNRNAQPLTTLVGTFRAGDCIGPASVPIKLELRDNKKDC